MRKIATKMFRKRGTTIEADAEDDGEDREKLEAQVQGHAGKLSR